MSQDLKSKLQAWRNKRSQLAPHPDADPNQAPQPNELRFLHAHKMVLALEAAEAFERTRI
jgi:hypothetical protein